MEKFPTIERPKKFEFEDRLVLVTKRVMGILRSIPHFTENLSVVAEEIVQDSTVKFLSSDAESKLDHVEDRFAYFWTMIKFRTIDYIRRSKKFEYTEDGDLDPSVIAPGGGSSHMFNGVDTVDDQIDQHLILMRTFDPIIRPVLQTAEALRYYDDLEALLMELEGEDSNTIARRIYPDRDYSNPAEAISARNAIDQRLRRVRARVLRDAAMELGEDPSKVNVEALMRSKIKPARVKGDDISEAA